MKFIRPNLPAAPDPRGHRDPSVAPHASNFEYTNRRSHNGRALTMRIVSTFLSSLVASALVGCAHNRDDNTYSSGQSILTGGDYGAMNFQ